MAYHKSRVAAYAGVDPRQVDARRNEQRIFGRNRLTTRVNPTAAFGAIDDAFAIDDYELFELLDDDEDDDYAGLFKKGGSGAAKGFATGIKSIGKALASPFKKKEGGSGFKPFSVFKKKEDGSGFKPFSVFKKKDGAGQGGVAHIAPPPQVAIAAPVVQAPVQAAPAVYQAPLYSAPQPMAPAAPVLLPWMTGAPAAAPAVPATRREKRLMKKDLRQTSQAVGTAAKLQQEALRQQRKDLRQTRFGLEDVSLFG